MNPGKRVLILSVACGFLFLASGCGKQAGGARVTMVMNAATNLNPDPGGSALSVVVRIYQLKDKGRLETADYNAIWRSDRETLSEDYLDRQERIIGPGTQETIEIRANPLATYLGIVALFRDPSGDTWRKIVPISGKEPRIRLSLRSNSIELDSVEK